MSLSLVHTVLCVLALPPQTTFSIQQNTSIQHLEQFSWRQRAKQQQHVKVHHLILSVLLLMWKGVAKRPGPTLDITSVKLSKNIQCTHAHTHLPLQPNCCLSLFCTVCFALGWWGAGVGINFANY